MSPPEDLDIVPQDEATRRAWVILGARGYIDFYIFTSNILLLIDYLLYVFCLFMIVLLSMYFHRCLFVFKERLLFDDTGLS